MIVLLIVCLVGVSLVMINRIGLLEDLLWSDPMDTPGRQPSRREAGTLFGPDVTKRFLEENHLDLLVRSHEVKMDGYDVQHDISFCLHVQ